MTVNSKWRVAGGISGNEILEGDGFFISYASGAGLAMLGSGLFGSDEGQDETALVQVRGLERRKYFILNGDFRQSYERLVEEGFEACKKFYDQQSVIADSSWSSAND